MKNHLNHCLALIVLVSTLLLSACQSDRSNNSDMVAIETSFGEIHVKLYDETPLHKENFIKLVNDGYYDGTLIHRAVNLFKIEGGDPESINSDTSKILGLGGPGYTIPFEEGGIPKRGALVASRVVDTSNPEKRSNGSQFFIVTGFTLDREQLSNMQKEFDLDLSEEDIEIYSTLGGRPDIHGKYTVFGEVVEGMDVVNEIVQQPTIKSKRPVEDIPVKMKLIK